MVHAIESNGWFLSRQELLAMSRREYHYNAWSSSLLDPFLQPFWKTVVSHVPLHVKASTLSVCGLCCNITATVITILYAPNLTDALPTWVNIVNALSIFLYQTFDGIDGKQAQRTQDGELEEYSDHTVDSISITLNAILLAAAMQLGTQSSWLSLNVGLALTAFYAAHWAAHQTHCLVFGYIDVSEAQWVMITIHIATAVYGPALWRTPILQKVIFTIGDVMCVVSAATLSFGIFANVSIALGLRKTPLEENGIRIPRRPLSLQPLANYVVIITEFLLCVLFGLFGQMPLPTILIFGLLTGKSAMRLVLQKLTKTMQLPVDAGLLGPLGLYALDHCFKDAGSLVRLGAWTLVIALSIDLIIFHVHATSDLKDARGVSVFTMNAGQGEERLQSRGFYVCGGNLDAVRKEWQEFARDKKRLEATYHN